MRPMDDVRTAGTCRCGEHGLPPSRRHSVEVKDPGSQADDYGAKSFDQEPINLGGERLLRLGEEEVEL